MEAHSLGVGDSFDEAVEELTAVALASLVGVLALTLQDGDELRTRLEETAPFADALEGAPEGGGPGAVTVGEQPTMVADRLLFARTSSSDRGSAGESVVVSLDRFGHLEVRLGDGVVGDAGIDECHVHGAVPEQRGDRFEAHASIDTLRGERVAQLVGMHVADVGSLGDRGHVAMDRAPVEGSAIIAL